MNMESRRSSRNCGAEPTMARYGIVENLSGTVSPVILDKEFFNFNMQYNGGIFIIMDRDPRTRSAQIKTVRGFLMTDPGYYRFTVQCFHTQTLALGSYAIMHAYVNSVMTIGTNCHGYDNGSVTGIFYLEAFDTVYVRKMGQPISGGGQNGPYWNNFMIEKVY